MEVTIGTSVDVGGPRNTVDNSISDNLKVVKIEQIENGIIMITTKDGKELDVTFIPNKDIANYPFGDLLPNKPATSSPSGNPYNPNNRAPQPVTTRKPYNDGGAIIFSDSKYTRKPVTYQPSQSGSNNKPFFPVTQAPGYATRKPYESTWSWAPFPWSKVKPTASSQNSCPPCPPCYNYS